MASRVAGWGGRFRGIVGLEATRRALGGRGRWTARRDGAAAGRGLIGWRGRPVAAGPCGAFLDRSAVKGAGSEGRVVGSSRGAVSDRSAVRGADSEGLVVGLSRGAVSDRVAPTGGASEAPVAVDRCVARAAVGALGRAGAARRAPGTVGRVVLGGAGRPATPASSPGPLPVRGASLSSGGSGEARKASTPFLSMASPESVAAASTGAMIRLLVAHRRVARLQRTIVMTPPPSGCRPAATGAAACAS